MAKSNSVRSKSRRRGSLLSRQRRRQRLLQGGIEQLESRQLLAIDFNFTYLNDGAIGFNHPTEGQARRDTLEGAAEEYGTWFNHDATIEIEVGNTNQDILHALGRPAFPDFGPETGFERSVPEQKILIPAAGDPNGSDPDGFLTVNWEDNNPTAAFVWELGDDVDNGTEADFHTAVVHELTHILGYLTGISASGEDTLDPPTPLGQPSLWNTFDRFVADPSGVSIITAQFELDAVRWFDNSTTGDSPTTGLFFNGTNAMAANGGQAVPLHSADPFAEGRSVSHIRIIDPAFTDASFVMLQEVRDGQIARRLHPIEVAIMQDLGYSMTLPAPAIVITETGGSTTVSETGTTDTFEVSLSVRPPTDVVLNFVQLQDETDEIQFNSPTTLTFTPVNWNVPQTVTVQGLDDTELDGTKLAFVDVSVLQALSDPLYDPVSGNFVIVENADDEGTPPSPGEFSIGPLASKAEGNGGGESVFDFVITRSNGTSGTVTVSFAVTGTGVAPADATDIVSGALPSGTLTFLDGEDRQQVQFRVNADTDVEADEQYLVTLSNPTGGATIPTGNGTATGTILDDDAPPPFMSPIFVGLAAGATPQVSVFETNGSLRSNFLAYPPAFTGGVRVAAGYVDGDDTAEIITGTGPGASALVKVFSGNNGSELASFFAYDPSFLGGVFVAAGDVNGDGTSDIITGIGAGAASHVKVIDGTKLGRVETNGQIADSALLASFFAFDPSFLGGVNVASGEVNDDGNADIIVGAGAGEGPQVKVIDGTKLGQVQANGQIADSALLASFFAYHPGFAGGVNVAAGDVNDDGNADIIVGAGPGAGPQVKVIDGTKLGQVDANGQIADSALAFSFFAFAANFVGGVNVAAGDVNGDGRADIFTATASGATQVTAFDGNNLAQVNSFFAFSGTAGVFVAAADSRLARDSSTSITLTAPPTQPVFGAAAFLVANINHTASGTPTGNVVFTVNLVDPIEVPIDANGQAKLPLAGLSSQTHLFTADYAGDTSFAASQQQLISIEILNANTSVVLTSSNNPSQPNEAVTFAATVNAVAPGTGTPTGTVTFKVDGVDRVPVPVVGGLATFTLDSLAEGPHTVTATHNGNSDFNSSTSAPLDQVADGTAPTPQFLFIDPTVDQSVIQTGRTNASPIGLHAFFPEPVTGFDENDLLVSGGTVSNFSFDANFNAFAFDVTPDADGEITVDIAAGDAMDLAGNSSLAATQLTFISDRTGPKPTIVSELGTITNQNTLPMRVTFDEVPTGFEEDDLTVSGGTISNFQIVNAQVFTFNINITGEETVTVAIAAGKATDALGNSSVAASTAVTIDTVGPLPLITTGEDSPTNASPISFTVEFGEDITGFDEDDVTVTGGELSNLSGSGASYTLTVTPDADGEITVAVRSNAVSDLAGNSSAEATASITSDRTRPTPTITSIANSPTNLALIPIIVTFDEAVDDFTAEDVTVVGGVVETFQAGANGQFTFNVSSTADGEITIDIAVGKAQDLAGNDNNAATQFEITSDRTAPRPVITSTATSPTALDSIPIAVNFGETVIGFMQADLEVTRGTISGFQTAGNNGFTFNITPTSNGPVIVDIAANAAVDAAANQSLAAQRFSIDSLRRPDLALTLLSPPATAVAGANAIYAFEITNVGAVAVSGVTLSGTLPDAVVLDKANSSSDVLTDGQNILFNIEGLGVGESTLRTVTARLLSTLAAGSSFNIEFEVAPAPFVEEVSTGDNTASATTTVQRNANLSVAVVDGPDPALIGGFTLYTLTVTNDGPANASNVIVTHTLPTGLAFDASNSDAGATVNGQTIRYTIPSLASTDEQVLTIATTIASNAAAGEVTANTTVAATETDPAQGNNAATTKTRLVAGSTNGNPVANADTVSADEGQTSTIPVETLLGNDTSVTVISGVTQPAHGDLEFDSDANAFVYTPDPNFSGPDSFSYTTEGVLNERLVLAIMTGTGANLATSQIAIHNAVWSTGVGFASNFTFNVDQNEASPAVMSALTSGELISTVTLLSRGEVSVNDRDTTVETLRWTLHNVRFESYSVLQNAGDVRGSETYAATFEQLELDVADNPNKIGRRFHVGQDFVADEPFNSNQFGPLQLDLPLPKDDAAKELGLFVKDADGNLSAAQLGSIEFSVSNDAGLETEPNDVHPIAGTVSIMLGGNAADDAQTAAVFLEKALDGSAFDKLELTRGVRRDGGSPSNPAIVESKWTLTNAKVVSFSTALSADSNTYEVNLEYEKIELVQEKVDPDGNIDQSKRLSASLDLMPEFGAGIGGANDFGGNTIMAGTTEQVLHTPDGDLAIDSFAISAGPTGKDFAFQSITFTTSRGVASPGLFFAAASGDVIDELTFTEFSSPDNEGNRVPVVTWVLSDARLVSHSLLTRDDGNSPSITETFQVIAKTLRETIADPNPQFAQDVIATFEQVEQTTDPREVDFGRTNEPLGDSLFLRIGNEFVQIDRFNWGAGRSNTVMGNTINVFAPTSTYSVGLLQAVTTQTIFPEVEIVTRRNIEPNGAENVQTLVLSQVTFEGYGQTNTLETSPADSFVLQFERAEMQVITIDRNGQPSQPFLTGIDFAAGEPLEHRLPEFPIRDVNRDTTDGLFLQVGIRGAELSEFSVSLQGAGSAMQSSVTLVSDSPEANLRLLDALFVGTVLPELKLLHKRDGHVFETWTLTNAVIDSYGVSSSDPFVAPVSSFSLSYDKLDITHAPRNERSTGKPPVPIMATIDLVEETATGGGDLGGVNEPISAGEQLIDFGTPQFEVFSGSWSASAFTVGDNHQVVDSNFAFTANANAALPGLFKGVGDGGPFDEIKFSQFVGALGQQPVEISRWLLTDAKLTSVSYFVRDDGELPQVSFTVDANRAAQTLKFIDPRGGVGMIPTADYNFDTQETISTTPFDDLERITTSAATVSIDVQPAFRDNDGDLIDDRVEGNGPNNGDGNNDGIKDNEQTNVTSLPHPVSGNFVTLGAPTGQVLKSVEIETPTQTPPLDLDFRVGLIGYELNNAPANSAETTITIFVNGISGFNTYYKFGPTADNPTPHYYRFLFDSGTGLGAEIFADRIVVHLKDGQLGDDDLTVNGTIVDPGAPVVNNAAFNGTAIPYQNPILNFDVSDDGSVSPVDVLQVINELNAVGSHALPAILTFPIVKFSFLDVNGDANVSPVDALQVINFLNGGEGEAERAAGPPTLFAAHVLATDRALAAIERAPATFRTSRGSTSEQSGARRPAVVANIDRNAVPRESATAATSRVNRARLTTVRDPNTAAALLDESACDEIFAGLGD